MGRTLYRFPHSADQHSRDATYARLRAIEARRGLSAIRKALAASVVSQCAFDDDKAVLPLEVVTAYLIERDTRRCNPRTFGA